MKLTTAVLILISFTASAQRVILNKTNRGEFILTLSEKETVTQGFKMLAMLTPLKMKWYDRYVVKDGVTYYKPGIRLSRKTYRVDKGNLVPVRF